MIKNRLLIAFFCSFLFIFISINLATSQNSRKLLECNYSGKTTNVLWSGNEEHYEKGADYYYIDDSAEIIYEYESNMPLNKLSSLLDEVFIDEYTYNQNYISFNKEGVKNGYLKCQRLLIDRHTGQYSKYQATKTKAIIGWGAPSSYTSVNGYCKQVSDTQKF